MPKRIIPGLAAIMLLSLATRAYCIDRETTALLSLSFFVWLLISIPIGIVLGFLMAWFLGLKWKIAVILSIFSLALFWISFLSALFCLTHYYEYMKNNENIALLVSYIIANLIMLFPVYLVFRKRGDGWSSIIAACMLILSGSSLGLMIVNTSLGVIDFG